MNIKTQNGLLIAFIMATEAKEDGSKVAEDQAKNLEQAIKSNADLMITIAKAPAFIGAHQFITYDFEQGELKIVECTNGYELGQKLTQKQKEILGHE